MCAAEFLALPEAVSLVRSGDTVAIGGSLEMSPMASIRELIRSGVRDLHLVCSGSAAIGADLLIGAGCVRSIELSHMMLGEFGFAPHFRRSAEKGEVRVLEHTCPAMASALQAGAMGIPFIPVHGLLGTDLLTVREDFRLIDHPYRPNDRIAVVPAIRPDVCLLHGYQADRDGNVVVSRLQNARVLAQASRRCVVTVEEIVESGQLDLRRGTWLSARYISAIAEVPYGAHPTGCSGYYEEDREHIGRYVKSAVQPKDFTEYLDNYIFACAGHAEYAAVHAKKDGGYAV